MLKRELINTTNKVRQHIGQNLHDSLSSNLAALAMKLTSYDVRPTREAEVDFAPIEEAIERARQPAEQARTNREAPPPRPAGTGRTGAVA